jgi:Domain of unknown function (DUF4291)
VSVSPGYDRPNHRVQISTTPYTDQQPQWPPSGRHILAHYDDETIIVYQAYSAQIGRFALEHGYFGGSFSYSRMSWVKPNFLWMMYRSDWGRAVNQEMVLAIRLRRAFFDLILARAVPSSFVPQLYPSRDAWQTAVRASSVRLQWDPDHLPSGDPCERRAIQLGLRGEVLEAYGKREAMEIIDMTDFVAVQRAHLGSWRTPGLLLMPTERVYTPVAAEVATRIGLDPTSDEMPARP